MRIVQAARPHDDVACSALPERLFALALDVEDPKRIETNNGDVSSARVPRLLFFGPGRACHAGT
jgi:hypothetical protein